MNTDRSCGCKSYRTCFVCEEEFGLAKRETAKEKTQAFQHKFTFCPDSNLIVSDDGSLKSRAFPGVKIFPEFVSKDEEAALISDLDDLPWDASQSGRRKQNFGPKANFKKRKTKVGDFAGFPKCTEFVQARFHTLPCLEDYRTVEQCSIEYRPETGACIDPHIDDCWIWGERIVQLNLLSDSVLTLIPYKGERTKYNLGDLRLFPRILDDAGNVRFNPFKAAKKDEDAIHEFNEDLLDAAVRIPLPRRSLLVLYGEPRYDWEHCILREDIADRRVVIAYRELTPTYLPGGEKEDIGNDILDQARRFW